MITPEIAADAIKLIARASINGAEAMRVSEILNALQVVADSKKPESTPEKVEGEVE